MKKKITKKSQEEVEIVENHVEEHVKTKKEKAAETKKVENVEKTTNKSELNLIRNLMETMNMTAEAAMKALKIPSEKIPTYTAML